MRRFAILLALSLLPAAAGALDIPFLSGRIVDQAGMIPEDAKLRIEGKLADLDQRTGIQIAVLTVETLEGDPIEDYSMRVAETWKLGQKDKNNGVLFLVAEQDRKMRIEVGYGLEPELTDLETGRILDEIVRPAFRSGDFGGGIEKGVDAIVAAATGGEIPVPVQRAVPEASPGAKGLLLILFVTVIGTFSMIAVSADGCAGWFLYLFLMPFYALFPSMIFPPAGPVLAGVWIIAFPFLRFWARKAGWGKRFRSGGSGSRWPPFIFFPGGWSSGGSRRGGGGWTSGGGGGFGGGGFSGGGGSFGGGGSSGSW